VSCSAPHMLHNDKLGTRLLDFKELATLMETAPKAAWRRLSRRPLPIGPDNRFVTSKHLRDFIDLNDKLFGPGKNEL
jgi:hypothetical protein